MMKIGFDAKRAYQNYTGLGNYSRDLLKQIFINYPDNSYRLYTPKSLKNPRLSFLSEFKKCWILSLVQYHIFCYKL